MHSERKREAGPMKIVGDDHSRETEVLRTFAEDFEETRMYRSEREKTSEEQRIIGAILKELPGFAAQYGGEMPPLRPEHIHIMEFDSWKETAGSELAEDWKGGGFYSLEHQQIIIIEKSDLPLLSMVQTIVHELLHASSFQSYTVSERDKERPPLIRRIGFAAMSKDGETTYLADLNEAITAELTKRFDNAHLTDIPELAGDIAERDQARWRQKDNGSASADDIAVATTVQQEDGMWEASLATYSYQEEREALRQLTLEIAEANPDRFDGPDDVFDLFAQSYFSGKLKDLARLIEGVRGKGAFRELAEQTAVIE